MAWHASLADGPVTATIRVPGSKSITNRALVLAALAGVDTRVSGALRSRDTDLMVAALQALGVPVTETDSEIVVGVHDGFQGGDVHCGLAGTVMRFVPPLAVLADGTVRFDGDARARERPLSTVLAALRALGASIDGDTLPFVLHGSGGLPGGTVTIDASASSQFVSGLLLSAAAAYDKGLTVQHDGKPVPSLPHIEMTVDMLRSAGVVVDDAEPNRWRVEPGMVLPVDWRVEPDLSNASVFLAAAAATGGQVTVPDWPRRTTQAGDRIRPVLEAFGATVVLGDQGLTVRGPAELSGVDVDLHEVGELTPTVAALAVLAGEPSTLRGIAHLRGHETDRLAALAAELTALGAHVTETDDGLRIEPAPLAAPADRPWQAYADHRMATAGAILGLVVPGIVVDDIECTSKTMPEFTELWATTTAPGTSSGASQE